MSVSSEQPLIHSDSIWAKIGWKIHGTQRDPSSSYILIETKHWVTTQHTSLFSPGQSAPHHAHPSQLQKKIHLSSRNKSLKVGAKTLRIGWLLSRIGNMWHIVGARTDLLGLSRDGIRKSITERLDLSSGVLKWWGPHWNACGLGRKRGQAIVWQIYI